LSCFSYYFPTQISCLSCQLLASYFGRFHSTLLLEKDKPDKNCLNCYIINLEIWYCLKNDVVWKSYQQKDKFWFKNGRNCLLGPGERAEVSWEGIQEHTLMLRFLGIISRVLRLENSTLDFCFSTRCYSPNLSFLHWWIVLYGFLKPKG
jgi:hypothetical protein